jgi:hypothetical protein
MSFPHFVVVLAFPLADRMYPNTWSVQPLKVFTSVGSVTCRCHEWIITLGNTTTKMALEFRRKSFNVGKHSVTFLTSVLQNFVSHKNGSIFSRFERRAVVMLWSNILSSFILVKMSARCDGVWSHTKPDERDENLKAWSKLNTEIYERSVNMRAKSVPRDNHETSVIGYPFHHKLHYKLLYLRETGSEGVELTQNRDHSRFFKHCDERWLHVKAGMF